MDLHNVLTDRLSQDNPYICLNLLETALICYDREAGSEIPSKMLDDLSSIFGIDRVEKEIEYLVDAGILTKDDEVSLKKDIYGEVLELLNQIKRDLLITDIEKECTGEEFLKKLKKYLENNVEGLNVVKNNATVLELEWQDDRYSIALALSPVWLPAMAEKVAPSEDYYAIIGPFASQSWEKMYPYFEYPEFRDYTAYFDPWSCQKLNISKGGLFSYFDWFMRDIFKKKFLITAEFKETLQDMGLMRYNDER